MPRILIMDDEEENLIALKRSLADENPGWHILTANTEAEGKKTLADQLEKREPVDVVITDLVMDTDISGMNILQEARRLDPLVMSILVTAKEKSLDRYKAFDYGAFDVVEKNIRGVEAAREINIKTRAALQYREWSQRINFLRKYFDPKVFDVIEREPSLLAVSRKTISIVFWDIRGFSQLCESLKAHPTLISEFLKEYCDMGARVIFEHDGVLDKFVGDGIMALFGVLNHKDDIGKAYSLAAVKAAMAMRPKFDKLIRQWIKEWQLYTANEINIGLGCGIHTGEVFVGNVGTDFRDQFTALGPDVNFASRIASRSQSGQILLSQQTATRVNEDVKLSDAGKISDVKNIPGTFPLFEVISR